MMFQQADAPSHDSPWDVLPKRGGAASHGGVGPSMATPWLFGPAEVQKKKKANQLAADEGLFGGRF